MKLKIALAIALVSTISPVLAQPNPNPSRIRPPAICMPYPGRTTAPRVRISTNRSPTTKTRPDAQPDER